VCFFMVRRLNALSRICNPALRGCGQMAREAAKSP
jgi:hypothetical protein